MKTFKTAFIVPAIATAMLAMSSAASAQTHSVAYGDLDLSSAAGSRTLDQRISRTSRDLCRSYNGLDQAHCERGIRLEVMGKLSASARADYAAAREPSFQVRVGNTAG